MARYNQRLRFQKPLQRAQSNSAEPSRFYGPTRGSETLWSIASKLRPDNSVSVQQTLLAIYRLNPQAFENQNIHSLLPASNLRVPSFRASTCKLDAASYQHHELTSC